MNPWKKKKRDFDDFDDIEDEFERIRDEMERMMEGVFRTSFNVSEDQQPFVYGFSMRVGPDGRPVVQEFGNVKPKLKGAENEREPLVDVIEEKDVVSVIAELPGIEKEDIHLKATDASLTIDVDTNERKYHKDIKLPCNVKPESAKASYKNGVLDVKMERVEPRKEKGQNIKIE
ncbi:MAG: archaeal heat shock protein Hsp20 [Candidatus Micrarchaeota archaeon]